MKFLTMPIPLNSTIQFTLKYNIFMHQLPPVTTKDVSNCRQNSAMLISVCQQALNVLALIPLSFCATYLEFSILHG